MSKPIDSKSNTVYSALDIAKHAHDALIQWPNGQQKQFKVSNTLEGYQTLFALVQGEKPIVAGFEPTADYHRPIAHWLHQQGINCP